MPMLNRIAKPTLIIHAKDDPFMDHQVIPKPESLPRRWSINRLNMAVMLALLAVHYFIRKCGWSHAFLTG